MVKGYWIVSVDISNPESHKTLLKPEALSASTEPALSFAAASRRWLKEKDDHELW